MIAYEPIYNMKQKVIVIVGPTASGKTSLSIALAKHCKGEVISADSRQIYRGLDIGTGKVTKREMGRIPHHLLDVASPKTTYTAHAFITRARKKIAEITKRGHTPIIVGGTGFYIDALLGNIALPNVKPNKALRKELEKKDIEELFTLLEKKDPERAESIDSKNKVRLVRALEIVDAIGKNPVPQKSALYEVLWIGTHLEKEILKENIKNRLAQRLKIGMVAEAKRLRGEGVSFAKMESLGLEYRYLARLLKKEISRKEFEDQLLIEINKYAKRQRTYFKRNKDIRWIDPKDVKRAKGLVEGFLGERVCGTNEQFGGR